jgi:hypothetical protein
MKKTPFHFLLISLAILIAAAWVIFPARNLEPIIVLVITIVALTPYYQSEFLPWLDNFRLRQNGLNFLEAKSRLNAIEGCFDSFSKGVRLKLRRQHFPNYPTEAFVFFEQTDMQLLVEFPKGEKLYLRKGIEVGYEQGQEVPLPKMSNKYFLAQYDIDGDGIDELLFGVIDVEEFQCTVQVSVLKYHPPLFYSDVVRGGNWKIAKGVIAYGVHSETKIKLEPGSISIARNFKGLVYKWSFIDGKTVYIGDA